jgi:hypothetical protein
MVSRFDHRRRHVRSNTIANDRQAYRISVRCGALREMAHVRFPLQNTPLKNSGAHQSGVRCRPSAQGSKRAGLRAFFIFCNHFVVAYHARSKENMNLKRSDFEHPLSVVCEFLL